MKIAFFTDTYVPQMNGVTVSLENYTRELEKKGHTVYIFGPKIRGYKDKNKNVYRLSSLKILNSEPAAMIPLFLPEKNLRKVFGMDLDIIHAHGNGLFSLLGWQVAKLKRVPFVLTFHNLHTKYTHYIFKGKVVTPRMVETALRLFGNICDGILTPSEKMKQELLSYGLKREIKVLPNFIDFEAFDKAHKGEFLRKKFKLPEDSKILLSVARLGKEKNIDFVIKSFKKVSAANNKAYLVIVGRGPEEKNLKNLARKIGISSKVVFTGKIDNKYIPQVYADSDIFIFASVTETQGVTVLEAAASGLPLVLVDDAAFAGAIENGKNGFSLPLKEEEFAEKIDLLLGEPTLREKYGAHSKELAKNNFNGEELTSRLLDFYYQTLDQYKKRDRLLKIIVNRASFTKLFKFSQLLTRFFDYLR